MQQRIKLGFRCGLSDVVLVHLHISLKLHELVRILDLSCDSCQLCKDGVLCSQKPPHTKHLLPAPNCIFPNCLGRAKLFSVTTLSSFEGHRSVLIFQNGYKSLILDTTFPGPVPTMWLSVYACVCVLALWLMVLWNDREVRKPSSELWPRGSPEIPCTVPKS